MATESEVTEFLKRVEELYETRFILNDTVVTAWHTAFVHCTVSILDKALQKFIEGSPKMPTIADIKNIAMQMCGGSFYRKTDAEIAALYNDPETCKVIFFDETLQRHLSTRVAKKFLSKDANAKYFYPLLGDNQEVIFNS